MADPSTSPGWCRARARIWRRAIKCWADASYGFLGRSPDHVASFFAGFAGSPAFYARGGQEFADNLLRFAAKAADEDLYLSYVIVHPTIDRAKSAHQQAEPYLYAGAAAERDNGIVIRGAQMLGTGSVMSDYVLLTVILPLKPGDDDYAISLRGAEWRAWLEGLPAPAVCARTH